MKTLLVTFELNNKELYDNICNSIRTYPKWARLVSNTWMVRTDDKPMDVRTQLATSINNEGRIAVIDVTARQWATFAIDKQVTEWMQGN